MNFFVPPQPNEGSKKKRAKKIELKLKEKIQYPSKYFWRGIMFVYNMLTSERSKVFLLITILAVWQELKNCS